jgi:hypothetical protein
MTRTKEASLRFCLWFIAGVFFFAGCTQRNPPNRFAEFLHRDLRNLDAGSKARLDGLLRECLPEKYHGAFFDTWYLWQIQSSSGESRFILFQACVPIEVHSKFVVMHFLGPDGQHLQTCEISTGSRAIVNLASIQQEAAFNGYVLEICTSPVIYGRDMRRQVYGVRDERVVLLRLENSAGKLVPNNYHNPNHTIGPDVPQRTPMEWSQALRSNDRLAVLEALVWLGGKHRKDLRPFPDNIGIEDGGIEDREVARGVATARGLPSTKKAMRRLARGPDKWVTEAAACALDESNR